jgi:hypothetical protein
MAHDHATVEVFADCDRNLGTRVVQVMGSLLDFALRGRVWFQPEPGAPTTEPAHRAVSGSTPVARPQEARQTAGA